ncbi:MAG: hypothetical protein GXY42_08530 [Desulfovibrionales bacterium]|nr:hypothetical protein [Desulfovibrionales bacterium]
MRSFLLFVLLAAAIPAWGAQSIPVKITSDAMEYSQKADQVVFTGNVHVVRDNMEMWSETLTVLLERQKNTGNATAPITDQQGSIKKIIAQGNVRLKSENDRSGTCGKATYDAKADLLTLEDNPVLMEGRNKIQGEIIKLYVNENRSEVIGGKKRVEAIFITPAGKGGLGQ